MTDVDAATAGRFLTERYGEPIAAHASGEGMWSRCFAFDHGDARLVARFGRHLADFECDRFATRFARPGLPIPPVHAVGEAFDGYYAISDRADGDPLEHVPTDQWRALIPAVVDALAAMGSIEPPPGWGGWIGDGTGEHAGWREHLMTVAEDGGDERQQGQMASLAGHPEGHACFRWAVGLLDEIASDDVPRAVVHSDLINRNVHVVDDTITGVFDWGCARYGDPLYEVAWFDFWAPWHPNLDVGPLLRSCDLPVDGDRHLACLLHIGAGHLAYHARHGTEEALVRTADRLAAVVARFG